MHLNYTSVDMDTQFDFNNHTAGRYKKSRKNKINIHNTYGFYEKRYESAI